MNRCVLFADVCGSSRLYEVLGDRPAAELMRSALERMARCIESYQGQVIKTLGDEIMAVFITPDDALSCALQLPAQLLDLSTPLRLRQGLQYGVVVEEQADIFGDTVNTAARIAGLAQAGQILLGQAAADALSKSMQDQVRRLNSLPLRGKENDVGLFEAIIATEDMTQLLSQAQSLPSGPRLLLAQGGKTRQLHVGDSLSLGRAEDNDWVIDSPRASRRHARIEVFSDRCSLTDFSSNGTTLLTAQNERLLLRHTSHSLYGQGWLACGEEAQAQAEHSIHFSLIQEMSPVR